MNTLILDTNIFLRILLNDVPEQANIAKKQIKKAIKEHQKLIVPEAVLFEINYILTKYYSFHKEEVIEKLKALIAAPYFLVESKTIFAQALIIYKNNNVSFVDSFLVSKAKEEQAALLTFDQKLQRLL